MSPYLNDLPDVCLLAVFKYLSLVELLRTIRLVNTRWSGLLPAEMNRRRSLVIVDDREFDLSRLQLDQYQSHLIEHVKQDDGLTPWTQLPQIDSRNVLNRNTRYIDDVHYSIYNQMQPEMITTLVDTLPRITSLTVVQRIVDLYSLDQIIRMIDHWRDYLVTLKLYLYQLDYRYEIGVGMRTQTVALFDSINRATALRHLTLSLINFRINYPSEFTAPLTILSQLSTILVDTQSLYEYLIRALVPYASTNRALQIGIKAWTLKVEDLLRIDRQFCDRFCDVEFESGRMYKMHDANEIAVIPPNVMYDRLNLFCDQFSSLVHLKIVNRELAITKMGRCLSKLSQLVHLSATIYANPPKDNLAEHQQELNPDQIVPVLSVRLLGLTIHITSHSAIDRFLLHRVFPNVQVLSLTNMTSSCTDCGFTKSEMFVNETVQNDDKMRQCALLARRPIRRFPRLHTIEIDSKDSKFLSTEKRLITSNEL